MNRRSDQELSLSEILRTSRGPQESSALEQLLRQSSNELLNATLPPDVRRRYSAIGSEQTKTIERLAREIRQALTSADACEQVLSGKVAEKVKAGIDDLLSTSDYTAGVRSIG